MILIGIDCAVEPKKVGIALARKEDEIRFLEVWADILNPWQRVAGWLAAREGDDVLIAIDAPLGWPQSLGGTLQQHAAGEPIDRSPNDLFRRCTDDFIHKMTGKRSLDVGANWIARTAHAALKRLGDLRQETGDSISLAWCHRELVGVRAIEVYPAATLITHGMPSERYKKHNSPEHTKIRRNIIDRLPDVALPSTCKSAAVSNSDALDAIVCVLAAADFVEGHAMPPPTSKKVLKEGWIWCRSSSPA